MALTYAVKQDPRGWAVYEDERAILSESAKHLAVEVAHQLAVATKAANGSAKLMVQSDAGHLELWDTDRTLERLSRAPFACDQVASHARL